MDFERFKRAVDLRDAGGEEAALDEFKTLAEFESDAGEKGSLLLNQANCLWRLNRLSEARECLSESVRLCETPFTEFLDALLCISEGKQEEAVRKLKAFLEMHADLKELGAEETYVAAQDELGRLLFELRRYAEAISPLEGALALADEDQRKWLCYYLGVCHCENRQWQAAEVRLIESLPADHRDPWWRQAQFYLGLCHLESGKWNLAEQELFQILPDDRQDRLWGPVQYQLGRVHYLRGAYVQAKQAFEICEFSVSDPELRKSSSEWLAATRFRLGESAQLPA